MRFSVLAVLSLAAVSSPASAVESLDFVVPDNDGYGIAECMKPGMGCGQVIADAWCEAHGHSHATAFGLADDVTGSVKISASRSSVPSGAVLIHCGE